MGCCESDSRPPQQQQYNYNMPIQQEQYDDTQLIAERPKRSQMTKSAQEQPFDGKHEDIVLQPILFSHTNVEVSKQKEIRLERLMEGKTFVYDFRCEFLFNYFIIDNKEHFQSVKGTLYFFDQYLYFYCPTQVSVHPYGEFIRYIEKTQIQYMDKENDTVFSVTQKDGTKFQFKVTRNQDEFIQQMNVVARELNLGST